MVTATSGAQMFGTGMPRGLLVAMMKLVMFIESRKAKPGAVTIKALAPTFHYDAQLVLETKNKLQSFQPITADLLLLNGSKSPQYMKTALDSLEKLIPHAKRIEFPGVNHGAVNNRNRGGKPQLVAKALRQFLSEQQ